MNERTRGKHVTWAGVVVKLDDGTTLALEFDGTRDFITADVHTLRPWDGGRSQTQDEVRVTVQGNGRLWREGAEQAAERAQVRELPAARRALGEGEQEVTRW